VQRVDRALVALAITAAMMVLATFSVTSMLNAALLATVAMLLTGASPRSGSGRASTGKPWWSLGQPSG
jgi:hypothetical protein